MKYLYFINLSVITSIVLYSTLISGFLNFDSFIIKFNTMLDHCCNSISDDFYSLYSL